MRFGLNLLLWCDTLEDPILPVLEDIKRIGYDAVEIPIFETTRRNMPCGAGGWMISAWPGPA